MRNYRELRIESKHEVKIILGDMNAKLGKENYLAK
jgi:hypothetical protein